MSIYQRINGADWRNIFVVGDLHGCYTLLMKELEKVSFDPARDLLISVGDLVDRGAENVECLELITMPWFRAVRGNHEQMMVDGLSEYGNVNHWLVNGGGWFFNLDYDKEVLAKALAHKAADLPLIIELVTSDCCWPAGDGQNDPDELHRRESACRQRHHHLARSRCTAARFA